MPFSPEYSPGNAIPRVDKIETRESQEMVLEQEVSSDEETIAFASLNLAARSIVEVSQGDAEIEELLNLLGNELNIIAHYETGDEIRPESKKSLLKRALRAAATAAREEIGRG